MTGAPAGLRLVCACDVRLRAARRRSDERCAPACVRRRQPRACEVRAHGQNAPAGRQGLVEEGLHAGAGPVGELGDGQGSPPGRMGDRGSDEHAPSPARPRARRRRPAAPEPPARARGRGSRGRGDRPGARCRSSRDSGRAATCSARSSAASSSTPSGTAPKRRSTVPMGATSGMPSTRTHRCVVSRTPRDSTNGSDSEKRRLCTSTTGPSSGTCSAPSTEMCHRAANSGDAMATKSGSRPHSSTSYDPSKPPPGQIHQGHAAPSAVDGAGRRGAT